MPERYAGRILLVLEALSQNPAPAPEYDVKKLAGMRNTTEYELEKSGLNTTWTGNQSELLFSPPTFEGGPTSEGQWH